jgi:hypothetical protein
MNKILSFIDAKCPQSIYKSIISDIEKIERQFEVMQTNKFKNLKLKEQFRLLINMLQSPNTTVDIEKTTNQINTILSYFRNITGNNLSDLEADIKKLCIKIGSFMTNFKIKEKRDELMLLKKKELELIETLIELIDNEVQKNDQNTDPLSKVVLQKNVKNLQDILSEIKDENDSHLLTKVNDVVKNIDFESIENVQNVDEKISSLRSKIQQLDKYEQRKQELDQQVREGQTVSKKGIDKSDIVKQISGKMELINEKSKSKNNSSSNIGQQTRNQLQQVDNMKHKFQSEISNKNQNQSLKKLLERRNQNKENIKNQKQEINNSLRDITNEDKKIRIGQMVNRARHNLQNEITDEEYINNLFKKTPPYSKNLVKKDNLQKIMKKADKEFGGKIKQKKSNENESNEKKSNQNESEKKKKNKKRKS